MYHAALGVAGEVGVPVEVSTNVVQVFFQAPEVYSDDTQLWVLLEEHGHGLIRLKLSACRDAVTGLNARNVLKAS